MKTITIYSLIIILFAGSFANIFAQDQTSDAIKKAMHDEMARSIEKLAIDKLKKPFYIDYTISDAKTLFVSSTLGSIITSLELPYREQDVKVKVGDYQRTNGNFLDMNSMWSYSWSEAVTVDNDYYGIRRSLWKDTDKKYKDAAEQYEAKISAINQQNLSEEESSMADFSKAEKVTLNAKSDFTEINRTKWETATRELSSVFKGYSQIFASNVSVYIYKANIYFLNSEGTETIYPFSMAALRINGQTQAEDGEPIYDHLNYYAVSEDLLPSVDIMKKESKIMADRLIEMKNAPMFDDYYAGPVLFEGQAVAQIVMQKMFSGTTSLIAKRKPILSNPKMIRMAGDKIKENPLEARMDKKIISRDITIKATPGVKEFNGTKLLGSFDVDAEGVKPEKELVLIDKGVLKNLLNDRVPTPKVKASNGHKKLILKSGGMTSGIGPGVIQVETSNPVTKEELKKKLFAAAKEEDLDYAIIVRKFEDINSGIDKKNDGPSFFGGDAEKKSSISRPLYVYKVNIADGKETLLRTVEFESLSLRSMKRLLGASKEQFVYNTIMKNQNAGRSWWGAKWKLNGILTSFIVPEYMLFEELDIQTEKRAVTEKLPVVDNPVGK